MNAILAEIAPLIREVFESPSEGTCATFEIVGNSGAWAQVMKGTINAAYPLEAAPEAPLREVLAGLPGAAIAGWEAGTFVTLAFDSTDPMEAARAVDRLLVKLFAPGDYSIDGRIEDL